MTIQGSLKCQSFKQWKLSQMRRHETVNTKREHYSPRVASLIPEIDNFLLNLLWSNTILEELQE